MTRFLQLLTLCVILKTTAIQAQTLNLKKKQKFTYETLSYSKNDPNRPPYGLNYNVYDFEVLKADKEIYVIKVTEPVNISVWNDVLTDSKLALTAQKSFPAVSAKIMTTSSYLVTIDKNANIINISGLEEIQSNLLKTLMDMKIPEGKETNKALMESSFTEANFKSKMQKLFPKASVADKDSVYAGKGEMKMGNSKNGGPVEYVTYETLDTNTTLKNLGRAAKTGLLTNYSSTYVSKSMTVATGDIQYYDTGELRNLVRSNIDALGFGDILFDKFDKLFGYDNYYKPQHIAARRVLALREKFTRNRGKLGLDEEITKEIDSLDKFFTETDYTYWAARAEIAGLIGGRNYGDIIRKVPYESLTREFFVMLKLEEDYKQGITSNLNSGIALVFRKFPALRRSGYPLNMHILERLVHDNIAKDIFQANNKDYLQKMLNVITETETLRLPQVDQLFRALKTYTKAKLATTAEELTPLTTVEFKGLYNMQGRYRLLIYDELVKHNAADSIRRAYLDYAIEEYKNTLNIVKSGEQRVLTRKYLADAYYRKSLEDKKNSLSYLSLAGDYMPDQQDKKDDNYTLEPEYVFLEKKDYNELLVKNDTKTTLTTEQRLLKMVDLLIIEPDRYKQFKEQFTAAYPNRDFKAFFSKALKTKLPAIPSFLLKETSGKQISNKDFKLQYTFIDFWGTWCGACVSEIHLVEALHVKNPDPNRLKVTTIACFDKKDLVDEFMEKKKYTYQVLMSDGNVENDFKVSHYPTKLLLLPNGVYLDIPSRNEYAGLVNQYLMWEF
ncbi:MAG: redoxin domain-containing protein [Bacteroidota bacterium]